MNKKREESPLGQQQMMQRAPQQLIGGGSGVRANGSENREIRPGLMIIKIANELWHPSTLPRKLPRQVRVMLR